MTVYATRRFLLALAVVLIVGALVYAVDAGATETEVCHAEITERLYEQPTELVEHQVAKHTRTKHKHRGGWSDWSEPELWSPLSHVAWVGEIPDPDWRPHAQGHNWRREWALLPTGETRTVPGPVESSGWVTDELPSPWVLVDERVVQGDEIPCPTTTTTQPTTTTVPTTSTTVPVTTVPTTVPPTTVPPTEPPRVYECDGDGDGIAEHDYNDPTDGVCAASPPAEPPVEPEQPVVLTAEMTTLPNTGVDQWVIDVGIVLVTLGAALWVLSRLYPKEEA